MDKYELAEQERRLGIFFDDMKKVDNGILSVDYFLGMYTSKEVSDAYVYPELFNPDRPTYSFVYQLVERNHPYTSEEIFEFLKKTHIKGSS